MSLTLLLHTHIPSLSTSVYEAASDFTMSLFYFLQLLLCLFLVTHYWLRARGEKNGGKAKGVASPSASTTTTTLSDHHRTRIYFFSLNCIAALLRSIYFGIPNSVFSSHYRLRVDSHPHLSTLGSSVFLLNALQFLLYSIPNVIFFLMYALVICVWASKIWMLTNSTAVSGGNTTNVKNKATNGAANANMNTKLIYVMPSDSISTSSSAAASSSPFNSSRLISYQPAYQFFRILTILTITIQLAILSGLFYLDFLLVVLLTCVFVSALALVSVVCYAVYTRRTMEKLRPLYEKWFEVEEKEKKERERIRKEKERENDLLDGEDGVYYQHHASGLNDASLSTGAADLSHSTDDAINALSMSTSYTPAMLQQISASNGISTPPRRGGGGGSGVGTPRRSAHAAVPMDLDIEESIETCIDRRQIGGNNSPKRGGNSGRQQSVYHIPSTTRSSNSASNTYQQTMSRSYISSSSAAISGGTRSTVLSSSHPTNVGVGGIMYMPPSVSQHHRTASSSSAVVATPPVVATSSDELAYEPAYSEQQVRQHQLDQERGQEDDEQDDDEDEYEYDEDDGEDDEHSGSYSGNSRTGDDEKQPHDDHSHSHSPSEDHHLRQSENQHENEVDKNAHTRISPLVTSAATTTAPTSSSDTSSPQQRVSPLPPQQQKVDTSPSRTNNTLPEQQLEHIVREEDFFNQSPVRTPQRAQSPSSTQQKHHQQASYYRVTSMLQQQEEQQAEEHDDDIIGGMLSSYHPLAGHASTAVMASSPPRRSASTALDEITSPTTAERDLAYQTRSLSHTILWLCVCVIVCSLARIVSATIEFIYTYRMYRKEDDDSINGGDNTKNNEDGFPEYWWILIDVYYVLFELACSTIATWILTGTTTTAKSLASSSTDASVSSPHHLTDISIDVLNSHSHSHSNSHSNSHDPLLNHRGQINSPPMKQNGVLAKVAQMWHAENGAKGKEKMKKQQMIAHSYHVSTSTVPSSTTNLQSRLLQHPNHPHSYHHQSVLPSSSPSMYDSFQQAQQHRQHNQRLKQVL